MVAIINVTTKQVILNTTKYIFQVIIIIPPTYFNVLSFKNKIGIKIEIENKVETKSTVTTLPLSLSAYYPNCPFSLHENNRTQPHSKFFPIFVKDLLVAK